MLVFTDAVLLFGGALLAGAVNALAGGGTLITFPLLIFTGMSPIAANATSTLALLPGALTSSYAYRNELLEHKARLPLLVLYSIIGGTAGAIVLLVTPDRTFQTLIPYLMLLATLLFTFGRYFVAWLHRRMEGYAHLSRVGVIASSTLQLAIGFYGGYFGAGIGILTLSMLELMGLKNMHEMNAIKTILGSVVNIMAVIIFIVAGIIVWPQALLMMLAAAIGGYVGAHYSRKLPQQAVRGVVMFVGTVMTIYFFWKY